MGHWLVLSGHRRLYNAEGFKSASRDRTIPSRGEGIEILELSSHLADMTMDTSHRITNGLIDLPY